MNSNLAWVGSMAELHIAQLSDQVPNGVTMNRTRPGLTIVELIVSMAILGLLVAVSLPAVQQARGSARRLKCQNNLKQWGLAMAQHSETHGYYSTGNTTFIEMLPGIGQGVLYNQLTSLNSMTPQQMHAIQFTVPEFVCPDDSLHIVRYGNSNYYPNEGTKLHDNAPTNGYDQVSRATRPSDIVDGFSHSAALAERLIRGPGGYLEELNNPDPKRYFWFTQTRYGQSGEELLAVQECRQNRTTTFPQFYGGSMTSYMTGGTYYNHLLLPNERACYNGPEDWEMTHLLYLVPPSSLHPGGVNVLFLDGSVRFIAENLDETVWRALGTINGNEAVNTSF